MSIRPPRDRVNPFSSSTAVRAARRVRASNRTSFCAGACSTPSSCARNASFEGVFDSATTAFDSSSSPSKSPPLIANFSTWTSAHLATTLVTAIGSSYPKTARSGRRASAPTPGKACSRSRGGRACSWSPCTRRPRREPRAGTGSSAPPSADVARDHRDSRGLELFAELDDQLGLFVASHRSSSRYAAAAVERASCGSTLTPGPIVVDTAIERSSCPWRRPAWHARSRSSSALRVLDELRRAE